MSTQVTALAKSRFSIVVCNNHLHYTVNKLSMPRHDTATEKDNG